MIKITAYNISLATKLGPYVSIGAGASILQFDREAEADKKYETTAALNALRYRFEYREKAQGIGVEPVIGVHITPHEKLSAGFVYRFGAKIKASGKAASHLTALGAAENSYYRQSYNYPSSLGLGICYKPTDKLTLTGDWEITDWTELNRKLVFSEQGALIRNLDIDWQWRCSNQLSCGAEYEFTPYLALRGGVRYDESPQEKNTVSMTNVLDVDQTWFTTGLGLHNYVCDIYLGFAFTYAHDDIRGVKYRFLAHNIVGGARYEF
jgi:long-subunit fatty acid transport protein